MTVPTDAEVYDLFFSGESFRSCAEVFGLTIPAVQNAVYRRQLHLLGVDDSDGDVVRLGG